MKKNIVTRILLLTIMLMIITLNVNATTTGGTISTIIDINDGLNYTVHTFTANGTFAVTGDSINISYLLLGGGAGGGGENAGGAGAGGGGAGGFRLLTNNTLLPANYSVIVGYGGTGGNGRATLAKNGGNTSFNGQMSNGGGFGSPFGTAAGNGGCGGGGGDGTAGGLGNITAYTPPQGYKGADGNGAGGDGGGGGAGFPSIASGNKSGAAGGNGTNSSINGTNTWFGGGGGGGAEEGGGGVPGAGGRGGGGAGGLPPTNGTNGLGGGGGGKSYGAGTAGAGGGSGVVIIRYLTAGAPAGTPSINFQTPTSGNNTAQHISNNTIYADVAVTNGEGYNTTLAIYTSAYVRISLETTNKTSTQFNPATAATYYIDGKLVNKTTGSATNYSTGFYRIDIYSLNSTITNINDYDKINRTLNIIFNSSATSSFINITSQNITLRTDLATINATIINTNGTATSTNYDTYTQEQSIGIYYLVINSTDNKGYKTGIYRLINITKNALLNITAYDAISGYQISNYTINITDENTGEKRVYQSNTTTNKTSIEIIKNQNYTLVIDSSGYAFSNVTGINFNQTYNDYNITTYTSNSVHIYIYDENTFQIINTSAVSITFQNNASSTSYSTNNGTFYKDALADGAWAVKFYSTNYTYRSYTITVNNKSTQNLNAYLISSAYTSVFTIRDSLTLDTIDGASFIMERQQNGSWIVTESKVSDISGAVQIGYIPGIEYRFTISKSGYTNKIFQLNPIIFSTYAIYLETTATIPSTTEYALINVIYYPKTFYNNQKNNLTFQFNSPYGALINYAVGISSPGGVNSSSGILANGETFLLSFNITNATIFSRVNITYNYTTTEGGFNKYFTSYEVIGTSQISNNTISSIRLKDYGMGAFEKLIIVMFALIVIAGVGYALVGFAGAIALSIVLMGVAVFIGFLPLWSVILSIVAGIFLIVATSIGGNR